MASASPFLCVVEMLWCQRTLLPFASSRQYYSFCCTSDNYSPGVRRQLQFGVSGRYPPLVMLIPAFPFLFDSYELADLALMFFLLVVSVD